MGGIICVDFIDMAKREHNKELTTAMKEAMKGDKAKHNILAPSRFGVVEMTRQRVRPVADVKTSEKLVRPVPGKRVQFRRPSSLPIPLSQPFTKRWRKQPINA